MIGLDRWSNTPNPDLYGDPQLGLYGRGRFLVLVSLILGPISTFLIINRVFWRSYLVRIFGWDDLAICTAGLMNIALTFVNCYAVDHGYTRHSANISEENLLIADKLFYVNQILYKMCLVLLKLSVVSLYYRIFIINSFRRKLKLLALFVTLYYMFAITVTIFQCRPIARSWKRDLDGTCINFTVFWYINAIWNIATDIMIFLSPMPVVYSLDLPRRLKKSLYWIFSLGLFVCFASIYRCFSLQDASTATDVNYGTRNSTAWTALETNTGIICACFPMIRTPIALILPKIFPDHVVESSSAHDTNGTATQRSRPDVEDNRRSGVGSEEGVLRSRSVRDELRRNSIRSAHFVNQGTGKREYEHEHDLDDGLYNAAGESKASGTAAATAASAGGGYGYSNRRDSRMMSGGLGHNRRNPHAPEIIEMVEQQPCASVDRIVPNPEDDVFGPTPERVAKTAQFKKASYVSTV